HGEVPKSSGLIAVGKQSRSGAGDSGRGEIIIAGQDACLDMLINHASENRSKGSPQLLRSQVGSYNGLYAMYSGRTTASAAHLWDAATDTYNYPYISRLLPGVRTAALRLCGRTQGAYVKRGNPKGIRSWEDLKNPDVRLINRERGSGTRILLDQKLRLLGIEPDAITGYGTESSSHLSIVSAVAVGIADVGFGCENPAKSVDGVEFIPLQLEWYDLVIRQSDLEKPLVREIVDFGGSAGFRAMLEAVGGYDLSQSGVYAEL
ncbi:MAG: substrate-binding domain-containing protein, partial [Oscillospiraceae bacterium]|nr:substrate-binding domain-containing protein [Oscillospiraceae bacterium]